MKNPPAAAHVALPLLELWNSCCTDTVVDERSEPFHYVRSAEAETTSLALSFFLPEESTESTTSLFCKT